MWFVDAVFEYSELKAAYFTPAPEDMLNDAFFRFFDYCIGSHCLDNYIADKGPE